MRSEPPERDNTADLTGVKIREDCVEKMQKVALKVDVKPADAEVLEEVVAHTGEQPKRAGCGRMNQNGACRTGASRTAHSSLSQ